MPAKCLQKTLFAVVLVICSIDVDAQDVQSFADGSNAIIRTDNRAFYVQAPDKATTSVRRVVTVLNAEGREAGVLVVNYDDLRRLKKFNGSILDANGDVVRRLSTKEQEDYSAISGFSLYDSNRIRVGRLYHDSYPYTVEFEYEIEHNGLISWPTWYPLEHDLPVESGEFVVSVPDDMSVRYRTSGKGIEVDSLSDGKRSVYRWRTTWLSVPDLEPYGPRWVNQTVAVHTAPTMFAIDGAAGSMATWADFGAWYSQLGDGRHILPASARQDVLRLTEGIDDTVEIARRIYGYLQANTRYVSIQLGLGGWQPYDAMYVHTNGYGDCKALTNYLYALLRAAGVTSFPVLIRGGRNAAEILPDFPSNQFTHVVLAVPQATDTLWLESTSQTLPFGHLGSFTEDRYGLLVKPGGGELVRTPQSQSDDNVQNVIGTVKIAENGNGSAELTAHYTGNPLDDIRELVVSQPQLVREQWVNSFIEVPNFSATRVDISDVGPGEPHADIALSLDLPRFANRAGSRLLLPVNFISRWNAVPPPVELRTQPVRYFGYAFSDSVTVQFEFPSSYRIASVPDPVHVATEFGEFSAEVVPLDSGALEYRRRLRITESTLSADRYPAFREFALAVSSADRWVVLLERQ